MAFRLLDLQYGSFLVVFNSCNTHNFLCVMQIAVYFITILVFTLCDGFNSTVLAGHQLVCIQCNVNI